MRKSDQSRNQLYLKGTPSIRTDNVSLISRIISELIRYDYNCFFFLGFLLKKELIGFITVFYFILLKITICNCTLLLISMVIKKESQN